MCQFGATNFHHKSRKEFENPHLLWMSPDTPILFNAKIMSNIIPQISEMVYFTFYRRHFLQEKNICWPETQQNYQETPFFVESILQANWIAAVQMSFYHKRVHSHDTQQKIATNFNEYTQMIKYTLDLIPQKTNNEQIFIDYANTFLQKAWMNFKQMDSDTQIKQAEFMYDLAFHITQKYHLPIKEDIQAWCLQYTKLI